MSVELRPLGVVCNIRCKYCYQNPQRDAGNAGKSYNLDAMKAATEKENVPFGLFGGEPLLIPEEDLEQIWSWGFESFGSSTIQTNGVLLNDNHIRMFKRFRVSVGISIDGPGSLNDARWAGTLTATRAATKKTEAAIARLCEEGIYPSLIVTLHRLNASPSQLSLLHAWFKRMEAAGIIAARLHLLEIDDPRLREQYALSETENIDALLSFAKIHREFSTLRFDLFEDIKRLLLGKDQGVTCYWKGCDPYTTSAVCGIEGNGQRSNCGRTNKDGIEFVKGDSPGFARYLALYSTPQEFGGCKGCRFFLMCKGQCPGTSIDGDWRNKTEHCGVWKAVFQYFEEQLQAMGLEPISLSLKRTELEQQLIRHWGSGANVEMESLIATENRGYMY